MISILLRIIILTATISFVPFALFSSDFTVVIDPGHGGKDKGALGRNSFEKDINLAVAHKLGNLLEKKVKDVKVVYTRNNDTYKQLRDRAQIANQAKGNLFISIHCNSVSKKNKRRNTIAGATTYVLGLHKSQENLEVAMRENSVIEQEPDYSVTYKGFEPGSSESYIIFELTQQQYLSSSIDFAKLVQEELATKAKRKDLGVKQAGFLVLAETTMPSVLIELDFICNPEVEKYISSKAGQEKMADAIFTAVKRYIDILSAREITVKKNNKDSSK